MPTLNWIGKEKVVNHHQDVPYKILEKQYTYTDGKESSTGSSDNKIIHGDNLEALKSLLPEYEGKIDCIYIDPPYNTGNEGWVYNDNVSHPRLKKWLGKVVGKESEDLSRHDKWLCMMFPRLKLLNKLLSQSGAIFISIDDNEQANLRLICDEIFGVNNLLANMIWEKSDSPKMDSKYFANKHDHVICYAKSKSKVNLNRLKPDPSEIKHYNKVDDKGKKYYLKPLRAMGGQGETREARPNLYYALTDPDGNEVFPKLKDGRDGAWRWSSKKVEDEFSRIEWTSSKNGWNPNYKIFLTKKAYRPPETLLRHEKVGSNRTSKNEINEILKGTNSFETPKPTSLIEYLISVVCKKNSIILDSFAGSGTTAHAVLNLNKEDGGNRKFILVEMEDYAQDITAERVKRVIDGYGKGKKAVDGTGGDFNYYELGKPLFNDDNLLNEDVELSKILEYVWYSETKTSYKVTDEEFLLGTKEDVAYYFYYTKNSVTTLDMDFLRQIKTKASSYIIYADNCLLDKDIMDKYHIIFKKIPRDISRF
ncbi:site-specific DNA-methyltransferase [uncultured Nonlabens sp.]|uniref:site-specific DNA-methyltransferase n=1 Tax=uncultured Nonlabens sp. TaxID=859306 RepID=UPI0026351A49|nr:site-specific DNA-methyltransferase [uncultured Nonlabens sp.]